MQVPEPAEGVGQLAPIVIRLGCSTAVPSPPFQSFVPGAPGRALRSTLARSEQVNE